MWLKFLFFQMITNLTPKKTRLSSMALCNMASSLNQPTTGKICTLVCTLADWIPISKIIIFPKKNKIKKPDFVKESFRIFRNILMFTWKLQKNQQLRCLNLPWYEGTQMSLERTTLSNDSLIDHSNNTW